MAEEELHPDTDGYYGDDDVDGEELDLSFLDEEEDEDVDAKGEAEPQKK